MTEQELRRAAKRWVCDRVAACLSADTEFFSDVLFTDFSGDPFEGEVYDAIFASSMELQHELERRGDGVFGSVGAEAVEKMFARNRRKGPQCHLTPPTSKPSSHNSPRNGIPTKQRPSLIAPTTAKGRG